MFAWKANSQENWLACSNHAASAYKVIWKVGRVVECGGLLNHCAVTGTTGSNPVPSAVKQ